MADRSAPTTIAVIISTALIAGVSGYLLGIGSSLGIIPNPFGAKTPVKRGVENYDDEEESEEEDIDASILDHAPNWSNGFEADQRDGLRATAAGVSASAKKQAAKAKKDSDWEDVTVKGEDPEKEAARPEWEDSSEECKLVLVVRTDLGMTKGKIAAQCGHATLACYKHFLKHDPKSKTLRRWEKQGQAKIALQAKDEDELDMLQATAISLGLVAEVIADAGRTQIASGSHTVLGIGPAPKSVVDQITGHLKLL
ncbi:uncharacterized protein L3040_006927 [Drepanopeziza brunnea f. sp. 'multigermtubi']|uniref:peptidyl-tRNA hydrolase n=1 Tax=Marssonina brunnea f. sp. multigermtubi (strain MB_m1) TaxID=1072389 RepID=K1XK20_MARBU|nr:uncharacterized protein MBM_09003 [Drepanopeziza brunnea f. sp. 'multigermtubi' MB_m1]EKD12774.1 hypothetical protein MBM_09003 [Drepanopeziza brunnea f. sp. 'multigermtubi' MB_m1]KAJ5038056.1 hypothetical protein L3040_006927 [Drepanopeziza brunnea f. sp. 'multigermtubi']